MTKSDVLDNLDRLFGGSGIEREGDEHFVKRIRSLQSMCWEGMFTIPYLRGLLWRLLLGTISSNGSLDQWASELDEQVVEYTLLKSRVIPGISEAHSDPLSTSTNDLTFSVSVSWSTFYREKELCSFIQGDLERLFIDGIPSQFFQENRRREMIMSILVIWCERNPQLSYRQGMHEILGPLLYCLEFERECFALDGTVNTSNMVGSKSHPFVGRFTETSLEAHCYWLFNAVMNELGVLYDTGNVNGDAPPPIAEFCCSIQDRMLREYDPELCLHLANCSVQSQLYGIRWSRLLFGREIPMFHDKGYRVWDYIFASSAPSLIAAQMDSYVRPVVPLTGRPPPPPLANQELARIPVRINGQSFSPMLIAISHITLAMLMHIRRELLNSDMNTSIMILMKYADTNPQPYSILLVADKIRRGVMAKKSEHKGLFARNPFLMVGHASPGVLASPPTGGGSTGAGVTTPGSSTSTWMSAWGKVSEKISDFSMNSRGFFAGSSTPSSSPTPHTTLSSVVNSAGHIDSAGISSSSISSRGSPQSDPPSTSAAKASSVADSLLKSLFRPLTGGGAHTSSPLFTSPSDAALLGNLRNEGVFEDDEGDVDSDDDLDVGATARPHRTYTSQHEVSDRINAVAANLATALKSSGASEEDNLSDTSSVVSAATEAVERLKLLSGVLAGDKAVSLTDYDTTFASDSPLTAP